MCFKEASIFVLHPLELFGHSVVALAQHSQFCIGMLELELRLSVLLSEKSLLLQSKPALGLQLHDVVNWQLGLADIDCDGSHG